jgi:hypothetical protein
MYGNSHLLDHALKTEAFFWSDMFVGTEEVLHKTIDKGYLDHHHVDHFHVKYYKNI